MIFENRLKILLTTPTGDYQITDTISVEGGKILAGESLTVLVDDIITDDCPSDSKPHYLEFIGSGAVRWIGKGYIGAIQNIWVDDEEFLFNGKPTDEVKSKNFAARLMQVTKEDYKVFNRQSENLVLYTEEFYKTNKSELLNASKCGNPEPIEVTVDKKTFYAIRAIDKEKLPDMKIQELPAKDIDNSSLVDKTLDGIEVKSIDKLSDITFKKPILEVPNKKVIR